MSQSKAMDKLTAASFRISMDMQTGGWRIHGSSFPEIADREWILVDDAKRIIAEQEQRLGALLDIIHSRCVRVGPEDDDVLALTHALDCRDAWSEQAREDAKRIAAQEQRVKELKQRLIHEGEITRQFAKEFEDIDKETDLELSERANKIAEQEQRLEKLAADNAMVSKANRELQASRTNPGGKQMTQPIICPLHDAIALHEFVIDMRGIRGEPCDSCGGWGVRAYPSTATWRGGIGGQMFTSDVCDKCWGSGDTTYPWPSHRKEQR